ncbi:hypothetical protein WICMUC_000297 [Wickerhamomyces mucosus]|uniref:Enoyl reductase (ER) domain-containing protein n=1 Tax=Wickerhamomyces mucosus TaxID=1378264 RepID=A0A9P8TIX7_9ASCO|nr:hypothetical protein WICMUC_000297 [Wickerhamomyces mucosus]
MNALIYNGIPGQKLVTKIPIPEIIEETDVIVKLSSTTICGSDLHIIKGDLSEMNNSNNTRVLGHEGIGYIQKIGNLIENFEIGDKVLISCITSCGKCIYCLKNLQSHCINGGWKLGHTINGTQAQYVRIPHANHSLYNIEGFNGIIEDESLLMLSDILPTGYEIGTINGHIKNNDIVAIIGAGSIGISTLICLKTFYNPKSIILIDYNESRLKFAQDEFDTDIITINLGKITNIKDEIFKITSNINNLDSKRINLNQGVDVAIECVGVPESFNTCQEIIAPGGRIANIGVHGVKIDLQLQKLWDKNIEISTGLVNTYSILDLLNKIDGNFLNPLKLITHHFKFDEILKAYEIFENSEREKCIKVFIEFDND